MVSVYRLNTSAKTRRSCSESNQHGQLCRYHSDNEFVRSRSSTKTVRNTEDPTLDILLMRQNAHSSGADDEFACSLPARRCRTSSDETASQATQAQSSEKAGLVSASACANALSNQVNGRGRNSAPEGNRGCRGLLERRQDCVCLCGLSLHLIPLQSPQGPFASQH